VTHFVWLMNITKQYVRQSQTKSPLIPAPVLIEATLGVRRAKQIDDIQRTGLGDRHQSLMDKKKGELSFTPDFKYITTKKSKPWIRSTFLDNQFSWSVRFHPIQVMKKSYLRQVRTLLRYHHFRSTSF